VRLDGIDSASCSCVLSCRKFGQGTESELGVRDLKAELLLKEQAHRETVAENKRKDNQGIVLLLVTPQRCRRRSLALSSSYLLVHARTSIRM
jgi:hypothetical protein